MINDTRERILIRRIARRLGLGEKPTYIGAKSLKTRIDAIGRRELLAQQRFFREAERYARDGQEGARQLAACLDGADFEVCLGILHEYLTGGDDDGPPDGLSGWLVEMARAQREDEVESKEADETAEAVDGNPPRG